MKIFNQLDHTHMPYIVDSNTLLYSKAPIQDRCIELDSQPSNHDPLVRTCYQAYDLYSSDIDGSNEIFVGSGFDEKVIACSPTCFVENGETVMNYILAFMATGYTKYYHMQRRGSSLATLGQAKRVNNKWGMKAYTNCETSKYVFTPHCGINLPFFFLTDKQYKTDLKYVLSCPQLRRITPLANDEKNVIMMVYSENQYFSCLLNLETLQVREIHVDNERIYKCSILDDIVVHTVRGVGATYSRQLHKDSYTLVDSSITVTKE